MDITRAGFIGLIGMPNAGKSTLFNKMLKEKLAIVSSKPQTTRKRILGVRNYLENQFIFVDSPGMVQTKKGLFQFLNQELAEISKESDVLLCVLSLDTEKPEQIEQTLDFVKQSKKPWMAVITKVDLDKYVGRISRIERMVKDRNGKVVSLESEENLAELLTELGSLLPPTEKPLFDDDTLTTESTRDLCSEYIREACFENLHQEVPFGIVVQMLKFDETSNKIPHLQAQIIVNKEGHKSIVIGKSGSKLKEIGTQARKRIEDFLGQKVFIQLQVSVKEGWDLNQRFMKEIGYVINEK